MHSSIRTLLYKALAKGVVRAWAKMQHKIMNHLVFLEGIMTVIENHRIVFFFNYLMKRQSFRATRGGRGT